MPVNFGAVSVTIINITISLIVIIIRYAKPNANIYILLILIDNKCNNNINTLVTTHLVLLLIIAWNILNKG